MKAWRRLLRRSEPGYLRAAHYFGDGWPLNCWSTMSAPQARVDFAQMREDGFNAVILVVPYRGFQITQSPPTYEAYYFELLDALLVEAKRARLFVILRIGYAHHICDQAPLVSGELTRRQLTDASYQPPWQDYLEKLQQALAGHHHILHLFLCWEEFWHGFMWMTRMPEMQRRELAGSSGYAESIGVADTVIPQESEPEFAHFHQFANRRLRDIYMACRKVFPDLGFEFRVDKDPLYNADGSTSWLSNDDMKDSGALRLSYWAPFIGARNEGEKLTAEEAISLLVHSLNEQTEGGQSTGLLIDQFNFIDDTHKYTDTHARLLESQIPAFLDACADLLPRYSVGYGLWAWRDYRQNHLYNPAFRMGLGGWDVLEGSASATATGIELSAGACLGQDFRATAHGMHARYQTRHCHLIVTLAAADDVRMEASLDGEHFVPLAANGDEWHCQLLIEQEMYRSRGVNFRLRLVTGCCTVSNANLYQYTYRVGVREVNGSPGPHLEQIVDFNEALRRNG